MQMMQREGVRLYRRVWLLEAAANQHGDHGLRTGRSVWKPTRESLLGRDRRHLPRREKTKESRSIRDFPDGAKLKLIGTTTASPLPAARRYDAVHLGRHGAQSGA